jgi:ATP-dependent helicase/nuclease subunit A
VSTHHKAEKAETYALRVWRFFAEHDELVRPWAAEGDGFIDDDDEADAAGAADETGEAEHGVASSLPSVADDREAWIAARHALLEPQRRARVLSATRVARSVQPAVAGDPDDDDDATDQPDDAGALRVRRQGRAGSAVGRATHATLQMLDLAAPRDVEAQVERQCQLESIPDLTDTVEALVRSALASDAVRQAARGPHHQELYVAAPVGDRVIEGYVDLLVETDDGLVVVDYKTDSARSEAEIDAKLAAYELQGAAYAVALEVVTGRPVVDCRFVFCRASGAIERSVADLDAAKARVRAVLA